MRRKFVFSKLFANLIQFSKLFVMLSVNMLIVMTPDHCDVKRANYSNTEFPSTFEIVKDGGSLCFLCVICSHNISSGCTRTKLVKS